MLHAVDRDFYALNLPHEPLPFANKSRSTVVLTANAEPLPVRTSRMKLLYAVTPLSTAFRKVSPARFAHAHHELPKLLPESPQSNSAGDTSVFTRSLPAPKYSSHSADLDEPVQPRL